MTPRGQRLMSVALVLAGVGLAAFFATRAFRSDLLFFVDPTELEAGNYPVDRAFNLGGMVQAGSFVRPEGSLEASFVITDFKHSVPVSYTGVLPDLFREGQGVIATGRIDADGHFVADKVLAKHDENYMPPDVAKSLEKRHKEMQAEGAGGGGQ